MMQDAKRIERIYEYEMLGDVAVSVTADELCMVIEQEGEAIYIPHNLVPQLGQELLRAYEALNLPYPEAQEAVRRIRGEGVRDE